MILLKSLVGSQLHGLCNEQSDYDYKSIEVSPLKSVISPFRKLKGKDSVTETEDNCIYELTHFAKLMANCNPTILEVLWSNCISLESIYATELVLGKTKLLHKEKIFYSHRGYANNQRELMALDASVTSRTSKAIVAYVRVMYQGISLLKQGNFDPVVKENRDLLLDIKYNFKSNYHIPIVKGLITTLEARLQEAYDNCSLSFKPDIEWLEDYLLRTYVKLGYEELQDT